MTKLSTAITTIFFDLDDTLSDQKYAIRRGLEVAFESHLRQSSLSLDEVTDTYFQCLNQASTSSKSDKATEIEAVELLLKALDIPTPNTKEIDLFAENLAQGYLANRKATPGAIETLEKLRERGYRLYILTNGYTKDQEETAKLIEVRDLVEDLFASEEVGYSKPDPRFVKFVLESLSTEPENCCMVGDNAETDVLGALNVGMKAVLYDRHSSTGSYFHIAGQKVPIISQMGDLIEVLKGGI